MDSSKAVINENNRIRVLYSFPNKLGADRICYTAWQQVNSLSSAADLLIFTGALRRPVPANASVFQTLARGRIGVPYRLIGSLRACAWHDQIVARRLEKIAAQVDLVHAWPLGALETLKMATRLGIPSVLERCNAHTGYAMEAVEKECQRLGVILPADHEHARNAWKLHKEEEEYRLADRLLCPSDFVEKTFLDYGYPRTQLARHQYGFDEKQYYPGTQPRGEGRGLTVLFAGVCAVRKGLHFALEAWLKSPASKEGTLLIAGEFLPDYRDKLAPGLAHSSVRVLGHRNDVAELMRQSDILILPSIEEGSALVTSEARGSGCVLVVSDAAGAICRHMENALVHPVGDVDTLVRHLTMLHEDRQLFQRLRAASLATVSELTWAAAGTRLFDIYRETIATYQQSTKAAQPSLACVARVEA